MSGPTFDSINLENTKENIWKIVRKKYYIYIYIWNIYGMYKEYS